MLSLICHSVAAVMLVNRLERVCYNCAIITSTARNGILCAHCADVPLRNYSLTRSHYDCPQVEICRCSNWNTDSKWLGCQLKGVINGSGWVAIPAQPLPRSSKNTFKTHANPPRHSQTTKTGFLDWLCLECTQNVI